MHQCIDLLLELMQLKGAKGAKALNQKYPVIGLIFPIPEAAIALDPPDGYEQLLLFCKLDRMLNLQYIMLYLCS